MRTDAEATRRAVRWRGGSLAAAASIIATFLHAELPGSIVAAAIEVAEAGFAIVGLTAAVMGRSFVPPAYLLGFAWAHWLVVLGFYSLLVLYH